MSLYQTPSSSPIAIQKSASARWEHPFTDNTERCPSSPGSSCSRTSSLPSEPFSSVDFGRTQYPIEQLLFLESSPIVQTERHHVASALGRLGLPEIRRPKAAKPRRSPQPRNTTQSASIANRAPARGQKYHNQPSHSPTSSESGGPSGSWKHSWNEVAALQTWRRS
ncbi:hypothetical protein FRB95_010219 [Tulasnella sp. JGI-2019a]|nr:hypothetical protein FRB95_010219 [Tulasnella sp. JGI-2019a]